MQDMISDADRAQLRAGLRRSLARDWPSGDALARGASPAAMTAIVRQIGELGLAGIGSSDGVGGLSEITMSMQELGRAACPVPLHSLHTLNLIIASAIDGADVEPWIARARSGEMSVALASTDPPELASDDAPATGSTGVRGRVRFVEVIPGARLLGLVTGTGSGRRLLLLDLQDARVAARPVSVFGQQWLHEVVLDGATSLASCAADAVPHDVLLAVHRACLAARALGACGRAFELVNGYVLERVQFGRVIGGFQAVQHKLANVYIALEGVRHALDFAAFLRDTGHPDWIFHVTATFAHAADVLPGAMLEIHHAFGAIGYAEEHETPRHFRRVHLDLLRLGGREAARADVARAVLRSNGLPDRPLATDAAAFRNEVRAWLQDHWGAERRASQQSRPLAERDRDFMFGAEVGARGWASLTWPVAFGGQARPVSHQLVLVEEMERVSAPRFGAPIHAAAFMAFGSPQQQAEHLERIRSGDAIYGIGYSEPGAGSDLASVLTTAQWTGDHWVLNGQKIWTTTWWGQYMWVLARTDPAASPRHAGLSLFVFPMDTAGITVVPCDAMYGGTFANVFYDNVRLPASSIVGEVNGAWKVLNLALSVERAVIGGGILGRVLQSFDELCASIGSTDPAPDRLTLEFLGGWASRLVIGQSLSAVCAAAVEGGRPELVEAAVCKVFCSELMEQFFEDAVRRGGTSMALSEDVPDAPHQGRFEQRLRHSLMHVISGGTNEIQRNLIAQRGLGLPRQ